MYICYLDESGTVEITGATPNFVLLGLAIPANTWRSKDKEISAIKAKYDLTGREVHTAWLARRYPEQQHIPDFDNLDYENRRRAVLGVRSLNLSRARTNKKQTELLKNYRKTESYIHLTLEERVRLLHELSDMIMSWEDCRLFADVHEKRVSSGEKAFDYAFEQVVTRFNTFLSLAGDRNGIIVQDNNATASNRLTEHMRKYYRKGTLWTSIDNIVETPLFVDSQLTSMVQLADLCAYATRRFFDKGEVDLFDRIYPRFDRNKENLVGLRHYTGASKCLCKVCLDHGRK